MGNTVDLQSQTQLAVESADLQMSGDSTVWAWSGVCWSSIALQCAQ